MNTPSTSKDGQIVSSSVAAGNESAEAAASLAADETDGDSSQRDETDIISQET